MIETIVLVVIGASQLAFTIAMLVVLFVAHRRTRRDDEAEDALVEALRGPSRALVMGDDRGEALAAALAALDDDVALRQLRAIAASRLAPEQLVQLAARVRPAAWVERILAGGTSRHWWKRMEAARLLSVVMSPPDLPLLARLIGDPHPAVASAASQAIAGHVDAALVSVIVRHLSARAPAVRLQQMRALREHAELATPILVAELDARGPPGHVRALVQLAEALGTPQALAAIVRHASDDDAEVRATVARALRLCFTPAGVAAARALLEDDDWRVRAAAARALSSLGAADAIGELADALRDTSWWVRFRAALALGSLGPEGQAALAAAVASDDRYARDMAVVVTGLPEAARLELSA